MNMLDKDKIRDFQRIADMGIERRDLFYHVLVFQNSKTQKELFRGCMNCGYGMKEEGNNTCAICVYGNEDGGIMWGLR